MLLITPPSPTGQVCAGHSWDRTYHLGGGKGGYAHYLDHLGPTQEERWRHLGHPTLNDELKATLVQGIDEETAGKTLEELATRRDKGLLGILQLVDELDSKA